MLSRPGNINGTQTMRKARAQGRGNILDAQPKKAIVDLRFILAIVIGITETRQLSTGKSQIVNVLVTEYKWYMESSSLRHPHQRCECCERARVNCESRNRLARNRALHNAVRLGLLHLQNDKVESIRRKQKCPAYQRYPARILAQSPYRTHEKE